MSQWTHVAACIRFDALRLPGMPDFSPKLGNTCSFSDDQVKWDLCDIPCGSEGSLQYHVWENPDAHAIAAYTVMIWGDLRDYENVDEIVSYLGRVTRDKIIRQGVVTINVEYQKTVVFDYRHEQWVKVSESPHVD